MMTILNVELLKNKMITQNYFFHKIFMIFPKAAKKAIFVPD
jgi:hypothetical protein